MTPWLSVVIPTYNHGPYISEALNRLRQQETSDWECVVIDDGSSDDTSEIVREISRLDGRVSYHFQENAGVAAARNAGLSRARGTWIAFLDADDYFLPEGLTHLRRATQMSADVHVCAGLLHRSGRPLPSGNGAMGRLDLFFRVLNFDVGPALLLQNAIFRRALIDGIGGFTVEYRTSEDRDFLVRASASSHVAFCNAPVGYYRTDHGAGKSDRYLESGEKIATVRTQYERYPGYPALRARLRDPVDAERFARMRGAYLSMLDAADLIRRQEDVAAASRLADAARACQTPGERDAIVNMLTYFIYFPKAKPTEASARVRRAYKVILDTYGSEPHDPAVQALGSSLGRAWEERR